MKTKERKTITINVTADDIKKGFKGSCCSCPIALAAGRVLKHTQIVVPGGHITVWQKQFIYKTYSLTKKAKKFILDFDSGKNVKPFKFRTSVIS